MTIGVLLADDQVVVRRGFRMMLQGVPDIEVVGEAEDGSAVVGLVQRRGADVVLMDLRMPVVDGIEATRRVVEHTDAAVLVVTTYDFDDLVDEALRAGAAGFLLKTVEPDDLVRAIRTVAGGKGVVAPEVTRRLIARYGQLAPAGERSEEIRSLSGRELEVLELVALGLSNAEIAGRLVIEPATVKRHIRAIFAKLDVQNRSQAIIAAFRDGVVTVADLTAHQERGSS